jgi:hypothetical protein
LKHCALGFHCSCLINVVDPSQPQILQPPLSDPEGSTSSHSLGSLEVRETSLCQLPPGVTVRAAPSPTAEVVIANEQPPSQATGSPRPKRNNVRKPNTCRDPLSFPEVDFPVKYVQFVLVFV